MSNLSPKSALAVATVLGIVATTPAFGQSAPTTRAPGADSDLSGVTVMAPKVVRRSLYGLTTSDVGMSIRVPVGDLDLASPTGKLEFDRRVDEAANFVCRLLNNKYPSGVPDEFGCVDDAVAGAEKQREVALSGVR
jgi:UrcA family protein